MRFLFVSDSKCDVVNVATTRPLQSVIDLGPHGQSPSVSALKSSCVETRESCRRTLTLRALDSRMRRYGERRDLSAGCDLSGHVPPLHLHMRCGPVIFARDCYRNTAECEDRHRPGRHCKSGANTHVLRMWPSKSCLGQRADCAVKSRIGSPPASVGRTRMMFGSSESGSTVNFNGIFSIGQSLSAGFAGELGGTGAAAVVVAAAVVAPAAGGDAAVVAPAATPAAVVPAGGAGCDVTLPMHRSNTIEPTTLTRLKVAARAIKLFDLSNNFLYAVITNECFISSTSRHNLHLGGGHKQNSEKTGPTEQWQGLGLAAAAHRGHRGANRGRPSVNQGTGRRPPSHGTAPCMMV